MTIDQLIENFELLGDWEERYSYLIDLGKKLPKMADEAKTDETKVAGCMSNVWLAGKLRQTEPPVLEFAADSDAFIVKGLSALLLKIYSGKTPEEILAIDAHAIFSKLGLEAHLSPTRANGLHAMVARIREMARNRA